MPQDIPLKKGTKVLITGHSFLYSLGHYFQSLHRITHSPHYYAQFCANQLKFSHKIGKVYLRGQRGAHVCPGSVKPFILPIETIKVIKPQVVILDVGSNDLVSGFDSATVASSIIYIAEKVRDDLEVEDVRICSILPRTATGGLSPQLFASRAYDLNARLQHYCSVAPSIFYHFTLWVLADTGATVGTSDNIVS